MSKILNILMIEDSTPDAILILHRLKKAGYELNHSIVDTQVKLLDALKSRKWDIAICDYSMPHLSAPRALTCIKRADPQLPFILISGIIQEEQAEGILKSGASVFVRKNKPDELLKAIEVELDKITKLRAHATGQKESKPSEPPNPPSAK